MGGRERGSQQPAWVPFRGAAVLSGLPRFFASWLGVRAGFPPGSAGDTNRRSTYLALMYSSFSCLRAENRPGELPPGRRNTLPPPRVSQPPSPVGARGAGCRDRWPGPGGPASCPRSNEGQRDVLRKGEGTPQRMRHPEKSRVKLWKVLRETAPVIRLQTPGAQPPHTPPRP